MLIAIPDILSREAALALGARLGRADWVDGTRTSGPGATLVKRNRQLPEDSMVAKDAAAIVSRALEANAVFLSAALPARVASPLFNRYGEGEGYGAHVDNAIRIDPASGVRMRTDIAATLFLSDPDSHDGGALTIDGSFGTMAYKLPPGHLLLYPASSLHRVTPVTRGTRIASFLWVQSLVREHDLRESLFDLDQSIQTLAAAHGRDNPEVLRLTRVYHNLVRRWSD